MTDLQLSPFLALSLRGALAWLFVHAAYTKLEDRWVFDHQLAGYGLSGPLRQIMVWCLPLTEGLTGCLLLSPWHRVGAASACCLLLLYALAMAWQRWQGRHVDCGCGGSQGLPVSWALVVRNLLLAVGAAVLMLPAAPSELGRLDLAFAVLAVVLCGVLYASIHQVWRGRSSWIH